MTDRRREAIDVAGAKTFGRRRSDTAILETLVFRSEISIARAAVLVRLRERELNRPIPTHVCDDDCRRRAERRNR